MFSSAFMGDPLRDHVEKPHAEAIPCGHWGSSPVRILSSPVRAGHDRCEGRPRLSRAGPISDEPSTSD